MRLPLEVEIRQDELRRAAAMRSEVAPLTLGDDCAAVLEAWWSRVRRAKGSYRVTDLQIAKLSRRMRALGSGQ